MYTQDFDSMNEYCKKVHEIDLKTSNIPVKIVNKMLLHWENLEVEKVDYLINMYEIEAICENDIYSIHGKVQKALS